MRKAVVLWGITLGTFLMGLTVQAETVTMSMNFRSEASVTGSLIGSVPKGAVVTVLNSQNGWDYISYNGMNGWIHGGNTTSQPAAQSADFGAGTGAPSAAAPSAGSSGQSVKVLYGMNFRANPGMNGRIIGGVPAGTTVLYLGSSNGWDNIEYNGVTGWIASGRTTKADTAASSSTGASAAPAGSSGQSVKVLYGMNFRANPGMNGRIIGSVPAGTTVLYLGSSNGWDNIEYNGVTGWIASGRTTKAAAASQTAAGSSAAAPVAAGSIKTVTTTMNFRTTGSLSGTRIGLIPFGSKVTYVTSADGWEQVIYNGKTGWIKAGNTR